MTRKSGTLSPRSSDPARRERGGSRQLLLVDDSPTSLKVSQLRLQAAGHRVCTAMNGATGLALLRAGNFDLVVLDWHLPDMRGGEFLVSHRRASREPVPVVVLTADTRPRILTTIRRVGAVSCLCKPVSSRVLIMAVAKFAKTTARQGGFERLQTSDSISIDGFLGEVQAICAQLNHIAAQDHCPERERDYRNTLHRLKGLAAVVREPQMLCRVSAHETLAECDMIPEHRRFIADLVAVLPALSGDRNSVSERCTPEQFEKELTTLITRNRKLR